jgi:hypothetical protein
VPALRHLCGVQRFHLSPGQRACRRIPRMARGSPTLRSAAPTGA